MRIDIQVSLLRRYPLFLRRLTPGGRPQGSAIRMAEPAITTYGIECGTGWLGLVDGCCQFWEAHIQGLASQGVTRRQWPYAAQIKSKICRLQIHIKASQRYWPEGWDAYEVQVELASLQTCEGCGEHIEPYTGQIQLLCDVCSGRLRPIDC